MPVNKNKTRQDWTIGETVKIGFLSLRVTGLIPTPGDYRPDAYTLENAKGKRYNFTPYHGLEAMVNQKGD
ncbi:MAG: hypothetical protein A3K30_03130 [Deltaproteobacteria bacterium RBG_13_51_10]|nr:MAG: hypothetical protein A3K30_03130 [Deltaproteobacteria bacterium RBG_13_51_10]